MHSLLEIKRSVDRNATQKLDSTDISGAGEVTNSFENLVKKKNKVFVNSSMADYSIALEEHTLGFGSAKNSGSFAKKDGGQNLQKSFYNMKERMGITNLYPIN